jgi:hypothetical protein
MSHKYRKVVRRCPRCRTLFVLGMNGVSLYPRSKISLCDKCAGIERCIQGAWHPWESFKRVEGGSIITRAEAFGVTR